MKTMKSKNDATISNDDTQSIRGAVIQVHAANIKQVGSNRWEIYIEAPNLAPDEWEMISRLFPHSRDMIDELLTRELLISSIVH